MHWTYQELLDLPIAVYEVLVEELRNEADADRAAYDKLKQSP